MSSGLTFLYREAFPKFCGGFFALAFFASLTGDLHDRHGNSIPRHFKWIILTAGCAATGWAVIQARRIQEVEMDEEKIRVNGRLGVEEIPLASIWAIEESFSRNPKLLILHVSPKSRYGETIRFIPVSGSGLFKEHPMIGEIEKAQKAALEKAAAH